ncbi:response regulator [Bacillota bacterium Meth-B3]
MYKVVLVDDEQIILQGLQKVMPWAKYGCEVVATAADGLEGARVIREVKPHMLLTDIRMPNCDGLNMLAALKSECPRMQISVLTAFREFDYAQQAIQLGVTRYLLKPSRIEEIEEAVRAMAQALGEQAEPTGDALGEQNAAGSFIVKAALAYIEQHHMDRISLMDVADNVFVSQWHLSKLLNRYTGKSFFELLGQARVNRACELLQDPSLKVHEVAEMVGFADVAHFSKIFKKVQGQSPVRYRAGI